METNWAIFSIWLIIAAFQTFIFALMVRALRLMLPQQVRRAMMPALAALTVLVMVADGPGDVSVSGRACLLAGVTRNFRNRSAADRRSARTWRWLAAWPPICAVFICCGSALSLFRLLRCSMFLRRHVYAILESAFAGTVPELAGPRRGAAICFPLIAVGRLSCSFCCWALARPIPSENVDVWVFHIPLAQSFVGHHGFASPQIRKLLFYSNQPLFFELLFATAMLAVPNFVAAGAVNVAILFGFAVAAFVLRPARAGHSSFWSVFLLFFLAQNFLLGAATPDDRFAAILFFRGGLSVCLSLCQRFPVFRSGHVGADGGRRGGGKIYRTGDARS